MAALSTATITFALLISSLSLLFPSALGGVTCQDLPQDLCAFAVSSKSKRCVLESMPQSGGKPTVYQCKTSEVDVNNLSNWIETDGCVHACGVDRKTVGISSDSLMEPRFTQKLCSSPCYNNCPNIVDLYTNLAAGEGVSLADLCEAQRVNPRRAMIVLLSSGAAPGPVSGNVFSNHGAQAPAPAPSA